MRIAMFTNTYLPHVGGVARSVKTLEDALRALGHEVRVVAPEFDGAEESPDVLRVPAIQNFNGSDFSVRLPFPVIVRDFMEDFQPDLIHSHHPFLLGDSALRESWKMQVPIVFTHHTLYERYTHYVPFDSPALKRMAIQLATEYCNLCDHVIAPSASIAELLAEREVITPVTAIPTGIDLAAFAGGDGGRFREIAGIPPEARVVGHVGRLAAEKNLLFLAEAVGPCLAEDPDLVFLIVGDGNARAEMVEILSRHARPELHETPETARLRAEARELHGRHRTFRGGGHEAELGETHEVAHFGVDPEIEPMTRLRQLPLGEQGMRVGRRRLGRRDVDRGRRDRNGLLLRRRDLAGRRLVAQRLGGQGRRFGGERAPAE